MEIFRVHRSKDGITQKFLLRSGLVLLECTYVNREEKHIVCFSTAVGCPIGCRFCAAGHYSRGLTAREMVDQALTAVNTTVASGDTKPVLFSAMGEGEPLLSRQAAGRLVEAFHHLVRSRPGARAAVSTTAIKPRVLHWLAATAPPRVKLQVSLHGATDEQRRRVIPLAAPVREVVAAGRAFGLARPGNLEWNYVLIKGLNDRIVDATALAALLRPGDIVKLNRLNPIANLPWRPSPKRDQFAAVLRDAGLIPEHYQTDGSDIAAACGQLRSKASNACPSRLLPAPLSA